MIWEQVRSNQVRSALLVGLMGALLVALGYALGIYFFGSGIAGLVLALAVWMVMNLVAYFQGDSILLSVSGARRIRPEDNPRLYHVVEEMKIASGLEKMPDVYIIDDPALNAFATGRDAKHASVAVTSGLLEKLNRDELQGVIGHEIAHIRNRDVLLMTLLSVLLGSIVILAWYASRFLFFSGAGGGRSRRSSSSSGGAAQLIILAISLVLIILAPIVAQIIYFAVSRRREYLSDASSALYTRYPEGLASALEKLATSNTKVKTANKATAPLFTADPFQKKGRSVNELTATHPPIAERVRILRAMSGASLADYDRAYREAKRAKQHVIPPSALTGAGSVALRGPVPEAPREDPGKVERTRETSDMLWRMNNYQTVDCDCGTRLRVPPGFRAPSVRCPHCGRINPLPGPGKKRER